MLGASHELLQAHLAGDKACAAELAVRFGDTDLHADLSASSTPTDLVRAFFSAVDTSTPVGEERLVLLIKHACTLIDVGRAFSPRQAKACITFLAGELDAFSPRCVADVAMAILNDHRESVRAEAEAKSHELLPKCLALLACADSVAYVDAAGRHVVSCPEFQDLLVEKLCQPNWPRHALLPMMNTLRELPLTNPQLLLVINKALGGAAELELQALPALVYQLLLLAGRGCKLEVLSGLATHFEALEQRSRKAQPSDALDGDDDEDESGADAIHADDDEEQMGLGSQIRRADDAAADPETLAAVQNTVILNIDLALRQDHGLGSTLLRMLKTHALQLSSFSLSLLLLLARQPRFEDEALAWLTTAVRSAYNEAAWSFGSQWLEHALRPLRTCRVAPLLTRLTRPMGPEHLLPSVVLLATAWMDTTAPAGFGGGDGANAKLATEGTAGDDASAPGAAADDDERARGMSSQSRLARLGANALIEVFRGHASAHGEILELVLARVASRAPSCGRWVQLLGRLARTVPTLLMHHVPRLRETLTYAAHLPPAVSAELLRALLPLCVHRVELRDSLVLTLRKATFHRDEGARLVAVRGFLLLLDGPAKPAGGAEPSAPLAADGLDSEILGFLKRSLSHQPAVRAALYAGLPAIHAKRVHLRVPITELLCAQLVHHHLPSCDEDIAPLDLQKCICHSATAAAAAVDGAAASTTGTATAHAAAPAAELEPLALLVRCLASCLAADGSAGASASGAHAPSAARVLLDNVRERMRAAGTADFGLGKATDFSLGSAHGQSNIAVARLLQSVLLALLEVEIAQPGEDALDRAIGLYATHTEVTSLLRGGGKDEGGKGGKVAGGKAAAGGSKGGAPKSAPPSSFPLALATSARLLKLASLGAAQASELDDGSDVLHAPRGEPLLRCAVLSAQRACESLDGVARTEAACTLLPLLLAEAEFAATRALRSASERGKEKEEKMEEKKGKGKDDKKDDKAAKEGAGRPYGAVVLDAFEAITKATTDRVSLGAMLRVTLASADADKGAAAVAPFAGSMRSRPGAATARRAQGGVAVETPASAAAAVSEMLRSRLEPLLARLLHSEGANLNKEADACLRIVRSLGARLPAELAGAHAEWALTTCREAPTEGVSVPVARALIAHWVQLSARAHSASLQPALDLLLEARPHVGCIPSTGEDEVEDLSQLPSPHGFQLLHDGNAMALAQPALDRIEEVIGEVEHTLVVLKRVIPAIKETTKNGSDAEEPNNGALHPALELQRVTLLRVLSLEESLLALTTLTLAPGPAEHAMRCIEKLYRALSAMFALAPAVTKLHIQIVEMHWQRLSRNVYNLLTYLAGESESENLNRKRTKREMRLVPALIFRLEHFEGLLVRLSKKWKTDLTSQMRRSTARDFRINLATLNGQVRVTCM
ncbi:FANCI solenoid 2-domain-containing protein [Pavlovales sp. CCMP2436]|nr:FANCI solenoid 2-domain-containing protein [Pavlovales sp. CCMP2436]